VPIVTTNTATPIAIPIHTGSIIAPPFPRRKHQDAARTVA
jgi:hypothetical protein